MRKTPLKAPYSRCLAALSVLIFSMLLFAVCSLAQSNDYEKLLAQAKSELSSGQVDQALADSKKAIAINPGRWDAHMIAGYALQSQKLYDAAIDEFITAVDSAPTDKKADAKRFLEQCMKEKLASGGNSSVSGNPQTQSKTQGNPSSESPSTPQANAPTYEETIDWLKSKIVAEITSTVTLSDPKKGANTYVITISQANFTAAGCEISWDFKRTIAGPFFNPDYDSTVKVNLADSSTDVKIGLVTLLGTTGSITNVSHQPFYVQLESSHTSTPGGTAINVPDQETAQRVRKALISAIQHCGGKPEPF